MVLIHYLHKRKQIAPSRYLKGQEKVYASPLIFQNIRLPELAPSVGFTELGLPRLHRAGPSTSLDKSAVRGYLVIVGDNTMSVRRCQSILKMLPSIYAFGAKHLDKIQDLHPPIIKRPIQLHNSRSLLPITTNQCGQTRLHGPGLDSMNL